MSGKNVHKLKVPGRWRSNYLPKVEKQAATRALRKLCRTSANDNRTRNPLKILRYKIAMHQAAFTISAFTLITALVSAAKVLG